MATLAACAGVTERIILATAIVASPLRSTAILAKTAASIDVLSNGRFVLGLGLGAREEDYIEAGADYRDRGNRLTSQLQALRSDWQDGTLEPRSVQEGGPPILIGGERRFHNRVVLTAEVPRSAEDGLPEREHLDSFVERGLSGAGMVMTRPLAVSSVARISPAILGMYRIDILNHPTLPHYDLSSLKVIWSGGQKVPPQVVYDSVKRWDVGFMNVFGMAEGPLIVTRPDDDVDLQAHTVGTPILPEADEMKVVGQDRMKELGVEELGELAVRGPGFFTGYFRNEEANKENFDAEGWLYTGDILSRRKDGYFEVHGRIKDTIIRAGENIYAPGVEDVIIEHPKVANVAVVGMPDERLGERVCAFVQLAEGTESLTLDELTAYLAEKGMAVFNRPERLEILDSLPYTEVGKVDKRALRERASFF